MTRSPRLVLAAAAVLAVATSAATPALAAANAPRGTLTATEYRQLSAEELALKKLRHQKRLTWTELYAVCHKVGRSTQLLRSVLSNCETGIGIDQSLAGFYSDLQRCSALATGTTTATTPTGTVTTGTTTTTTGTTTTGTTPTGSGTLSPTDLKLLACLQPEYAVIGRATKSVYASQSALRRQVLIRHFTGRCLLTLAPTTRQLQLLRRFVATAKRLAADVDVITKVADGSAPASDINGPQTERDSVAFTAAGKAFERLRRPQNLAVCRHE